MTFYRCCVNVDTSHGEGLLRDGRCFHDEYLAVKKEITERWLDHRELDFLICNEQEPYVELILTGCTEEYLNTVREGQKF